MRGSRFLFRFLPFLEFVGAEEAKEANDEVEEPYEYGEKRAAGVGWISDVG
jgi:hypothetical protein